MANWQDLNRGSSQHYLGVMYLYWGLPAIFAMGWALYRRNWRPYGQAAAVLAGCLILVLDPGGLIYRVILRIPALANTAQSYNFCEGMAAMAALIAAIGVADFLDSGARKAAAALADARGAGGDGGVGGAPALDLGAWRRVRERRQGRGGNGGRGGVVLARRCGRCAARAAPGGPGWRRR